MAIDTAVVFHDGRSDPIPESVGKNRNVITVYDQCLERIGDERTSGRLLQWFAVPVVAHRRSGRMGVNAG